VPLAERRSGHVHREAARGDARSQGPSVPAHQADDPAHDLDPPALRDRFAGMELLYLTTVGARSGAHRTTPVARFDDGAGGWIIVASAGGAAQHPGWYHNIAAHPDEVQVEVEGTRHRVQVEQLEGVARSEAWARVVEKVPRFEGYTTKTDRQLPLLHLTPVT
jgi:deazaflavin-dependent oxidoreductase (nitroreductase family)